MCVRDLLNNSIEIQGVAIIKSYDENTSRAKICGLYANDDEMLDKEIKHMYADDGVLVFEV